ncbi:DGQHR domain-containing protein [Agitococcus lubricus]|uniref:DNA phosphorothioation-associated DGQHR protein 1 n=1 Tax=Agitococcus lubricus TaxID=1077255 RepID=A0A2T5IX99_9GAMM|nr:DGQHR domain-containing protein [Agitococcus lubricus]PTQ88581.1 DNA phosphorothioation-associated DGQHR protein 1 [Agitococcus lubricus]
MTQEIRLPAIKVEQPIGVFYAVCMDAKFLSDVSFSTRADYKRKDFLDGILSLNSGNQRKLDEKRSDDIGGFIDSTEATFPNAIIIGANIDKDGSLIEDNASRWRIEEKSDGYELVIPSKNKVVTIIDGQHRLSGFSHSERKTMPLLCSVFIDLPAPYHAYIFATININQKKVDKSLAYELYGFKLEDEPKAKWSPEKLAVYIARRMNAHHSFLKGKIKLGASIDGEKAEGIVSLATIVDGILKLITTNPKSDRDELLNYKNTKGRNGLSNGSKNTPLRQLYLDGQDAKIESIIFQYFEAIYQVLGDKQKPNSYLFKSVGFQSLFELLKRSLSDNNSTFDYEKTKKALSVLEKVDFSDIFFTASGIGASRIKNVCFILLNYKSLNELIQNKDYQDYQKFLKDMN